MRPVAQAHARMTAEAKRRATPMVRSVNATEIGEPGSPSHPEHPVGESLLHATGGPGPRQDDRGSEEEGHADGSERERDRQGSIHLSGPLSNKTYGSPIHLVSGRPRPPRPRDAGG